MRMIIGVAVNLHFIWALLRIFGRAILMAVLLSIWRDWIKDLNNQQESDAQ
jgi:hypothetical protein